jgi:5'-3' exonuclease
MSFSNVTPSNQSPQNLPIIQKLSESDLYGLIQDIILRSDKLPNVLRVYGITEEEYVEYIQAYDAVRKLITSAGANASFALKARAHAEELLHTMVQQITNPLVSPTDKNKLYENLVKWGKLYKEDPPQVNTQINLPSFTFNMNAASKKE